MSGRGRATICPNCGAQDSLYQEVEVEISAERKVYIEGAGGSQKVTYGMVDPNGGVEEITEAQCIGCNRCKATWADEEDLLDIGPPLEHRCSQCSWWGFNDFQHSLERPDCPGEVYRCDKKPDGALA